MAATHPGEGAQGRGPKPTGIAHLPADPGGRGISRTSSTARPHVRRTGPPNTVLIAGPDRLRRPILAPDVGVAFNDDATTDLAGDTLTVMARLFNHPR